MDAEEFRHCGHELIDWIANYMETLHTRPVVPDVQPGYLRQALPAKAPEQPQEWQEIFNDFKEHVLRGTTHWCHPRFMAYFPIGMSYPSILGELASTVFGVGFSWASNPSLTELERLVLDWLVEMLGLPRHFRHDSGVGGGAMQCSASDCVLVSLMSARRRKLEQLKSRGGDSDRNLVAYCSELAHSCVEKAASLLCIRLRQLPCSETELALEGETLEKAIEEDEEAGNAPFYVCVVLGTTSCASCDQLNSIGRLCQQRDLWCHVDAAYAGSAFLCQEHRVHLKGIEMADSFNFNANKWMLCNFDSCILWVKDANWLVESMRADPLYLRHNSQGRQLDMRNWGVHLSRRFRALKLWFVIRRYGVERLRQHIRQHCRLAQLLRDQLLKDERFQLVNKVLFSLVCVKFRANNALTKLLLCSINQSRQLHLVPATVKGQYVMRLSIVREAANEADVSAAVDAVLKHADLIDKQIGGMFNNHMLMMKSEIGLHNQLTVTDCDAQLMSSQAYSNSQDSVSFTSQLAETSDLFVGLSPEQRDSKWRRMLREMQTSIDGWWENEEEDVEEEEEKEE